MIQQSWRLAFNVQFHRSDACNDIRNMPKMYVYSFWR